MSDQGSDNSYTPEEATRRRDEVIRRMANTPPQPRPTSKAIKPKESGEDRELSRSHRGRGASAKSSPQE